VIDAAMAAPQELDPADRGKVFVARLVADRRRAA